MMHQRTGPASGQMVSDAPPEGAFPRKSLSF